MTTKEMIAVMQAYEEGKKIQARHIGEDEWWNNKNPSWAWSTYEYRIKPEEEKPKRMTNRQLAEWIAKGQWSRGSLVHSEGFVYADWADNDPVDSDITIRPWGSDEWIEPTVEIYKIDCKGE